MHWKNYLLKLIKEVSGPKMVWGYKSIGGSYKKNVRISNTSFIDHPENLTLGDNVFIGHYNYLEASSKLVIGEGCQITNFISITTHSSHISIRLYGKEYINNYNHIGYVKGPIEIGDYCFIGPHSVITPNTSIGKGSIISAYSYVSGKFPDFSIIRGNPAVVTGDTRELDKKYLENNPELRAYYLQWSELKEVEDTIKSH